MKNNNLVKIIAGAVIGTFLMIVVGNPAQAVEQNVVKASSDVAASLNRISSEKTTAADYTAMALGTGSKYQGVTVTVIPVYRTIQLYSVKGAVDERCVTPDLSSTKLKFISKAVTCAAYASVLGADIDTYLIKLHKGLTAIALTAFTVSKEGLFGRPRMTVATLQKFGATRVSKGYKVTNTKNGFLVALSERPAAAFYVTVDSTGKVKI